MVAPVTVFKSSDTGAPSLSGTAGDLVNVLSHCLIIGKVYGTTDDSSFTDNTTEARLNAGTTFKLFTTPATGDRTYFGHSVKFTSLTFDLGTLGTSATYVWEYWNGSAWATLTVTDGTSSFTANGSVTWTAPSGWATTSVNGTTLYWVRVRFTGSAPGTNPLVNSVTYLGWLEYYSASNQRTYRQGSGSNQYYLHLDDSGPGAGGAKEARIWGSETASAVLTGTNLFPTSSQSSTHTFARKSTTADATTRGWIVVADGRTVYMFVLTGDVVGNYMGWMFGEIYSFKGAGDSGRCAVHGRVAENSGTAGNESFDLGATIGSNNSGVWLARDTQNNVGAIAAGKVGDISLGHANGGVNVGTLTFTNPSDSRIYLVPVRVMQTTGGNQIRGRMRGLWWSAHAISNFSDGDTLSGTGDLAGKTFLIIKGTPNSGLHVLETSNTWESN
jgi:hypothetical protein